MPKALRICGRFFWGTKIRKIRLGRTVPNKPSSIWNRIRQKIDMSAQLQIFHSRTSKERKKMPRLPRYYSYLIDVDFSTMYHVISPFSLWWIGRYLNGESLSSPKNNISFLQFIYMIDWLVSMLYQYIFIYALRW